MPSQSITKRPASKPAKPYADFPLYAHASGRWAKKIRQRLHYFGRRDDPDGALQRYLDDKDDLHAGRTPRPPTDELTLADLCNGFLGSKETLLNSGEITPRTFAEYVRTAARLVKRLVPPPGPCGEDATGDERGDLLESRGGEQEGYTPAGSK